MPKAGEVNKFRTDIILADKECKEQASNKLRFIYLALPLFKKEPAECESDFDKWIYDLTHVEALSKNALDGTKEKFREA